MKKFDRVTVYWVDIASPGSYWATEEESTIEQCVSKGFFIKQTDKEVCIAQTISTTDLENVTHFGGLLSIPRSVISKIIIDTDEPGVTKVEFG